MKKFLPLLVLFLLLANAAALEVNNRTIQISIDKQGYAHIIENYFLRFSHPFEFEQFKTEAEENKSSLLAWGADFNWFYPHFGDRIGTSAPKYYVTFDESERLLTLDYTLTERFANLESEEARETFWKISDRRLSEFEKQGLIVIPENTTMSITLPPEAEINLAKLSSNAKVEGNTVMLHAISTNYINLQYSISKPIASVDSYEIIQNLLTGSENILIIAVLIVIAALVFWRRRGISERIEKYIIEHSEIESKEPEEETEIEI